MFRLSFRLFSALAGLAFAAYFLGVRSPADVKSLIATGRSALNEATRPGDAALGCPDLEKELMATMSGPAMQRYVAKIGVGMKGPGKQNAASIVASMGQMRANQAGALTEILPQLARSERLIALGLTKRCSWATIQSR